VHFRSGMCAARERFSGLARSEVDSSFFVFSIKRDLKLITKVPIFWRRLLCLSTIPSPDPVLRRTCVEDWWWWLPLKNSASESSWCLAKHLWLDLYVNTNSTFHVAKLFIKFSWMYLLIKCLMLFFHWSRWNWL
jgi:hypothetical protein